MNKYVLQLLKKFAGINVDELQAEFNRVQGENVKLSTQLRHAQDKINSMERQISRLQDEATTCQNNAKENEEKHQKTIGEISLQNKELNTHIDEKDELIKQLNKENIDRNKACEEMQEKYEQLDKHLKVQEETYEKKIKELTENLRTVQQQNEAALSKYRQDITELHDKLHCIEIERNQIAQSAQEKEDQLKSTESSLSEALVQIQKMNIRFQDSEKQNKENETERDSLQDDIQKLTQKLLASETLQKELRTQLDEAENKNNRLTFQLEEHTSKSQEYVASLKESKILIQKQEKEIETLKEQQDNAETQSKVTETKLSKILSANKELEIQTGEMKQKLTNAENKLKDLAEQLKAEEAQKQSAEEQRNDTQEKLSAALRELDVQKELIKQLKKELEPQEEKNIETSHQESSSIPSSSQKETKEKLQTLTEKYAYIRITTARKSQCIFASKKIHIKNGLFDWGIEGQELILDEEHYIPNDEIIRMEGIDNPYSTSEITCDFSNEGNGAEVAETLLTAICCYHPIRITYKDKNGRISLRHLHYICFQPQASNYSLPYANMFQEMLSDNLDTDHIAAICAHHPEARTFIINQIQTIQVFDAFVTTQEGLKALQEGIRLANEDGQTELSELLSGCIPA